MTGQATERVKDPAAVALGRRGGLKGGNARADALSPRERKQIAKKAAQARWVSRNRNSPIELVWATYQIDRLLTYQYDNRQ